MNDLISRQAAIEVASKECFELRGVFGRIKDSLNELPSVQPKTCAYWDRESNFCALHRPSAQPDRKKGKWISGACNQCGSHAPYWPMASTYYESNFCPNCGADMRGEKEK